MNSSSYEHLKFINNRVGTPFYLIDPSSILSAWQNLRDELHKAGVKSIIKQWYSVKTHPVKQVMEFWRDSSCGGVEVVSEYEYVAALSIGFRPEDILVNGVTKHKWLGKYNTIKCNVIFDSQTQINTLLSCALENQWKVGLRFHSSVESDPDEESVPSQFGLDRISFLKASKYLKKHGLDLDIVSLHLKTSMSDMIIFDQALHELIDVMKSCDLSPRILDCGGGLPDKDIRQIYSENYPWTLSEYSSIINNKLNEFPYINELWLENGRYITSQTTVLAVSVIDIKVIQEKKFVICDGGRVNNALPSEWERHVISYLINSGDQTDLEPTYICGPTCMAWDKLGYYDLPKSIEVGDIIVWHGAGAYHLPWETRFSGGISPVIFYNEDKLCVIRNRDTFSNWWNGWINGGDL